MPLFSIYLRDLAQRRAIRRLPDGARVTYRLKVRGEAVLTIVSDELDHTQPCLVMSEPWPKPLVANAHLEFMRKALQFNRSAIHHLHAGVCLDPLGTGQYRLVWKPSAEDLDASTWQSRLLLFARLTEKAWDVLPRPGARLGHAAAGEDEHHMIFMP